MSRWRAAFSWNAKGHASAIALSETYAVHAEQHVIVVGHLFEPKRINLHGHKCTITSLCIGNDIHAHSLISASKGLLLDWGDGFNTDVSADIIFLWNLEEATSSPIILAAESQLLERAARCIRFSPKGARAAVCVGNEVLVFDLPRLPSDKVRCSAILEGHTGSTTAADFIAEHLLVTASEDRTWQLFDIESKKLVYRSSIYPSPLSSLATEYAWTNPNFLDKDSPSRFCIGTLSGQVYFLETMAGGRVRTLQTVSTSREIRKHRGKSACPGDDENDGPAVIGPSTSNQLLRYGDVDNLNNQQIVEPDDAECSVIALCFAPRPIELDPRADLRSRHHRKLLVGTPESVLAIDADTFAVEVLASANEEDCTPPVLAMHTAVLYAMSTNGAIVKCLIAAAFEPALSVYEWWPYEASPNATVSIGQQRSGSSSGCSMLPSLPLERLLTLSKQTRKTSASPAKMGSGKGAGKAGSALNKPLTFHSKVKSSGYGSSGSSKPIKKKSTSKQKSSTPQQSAREYPSDCGLLVHLQEKNKLNHRLHEAPILYASYSPDGGRLVTCSTDKLALVLKLPVSKYKGKTKALVGHEGAVQSAMFSSDSSLVVTASDDGAARIFRIRTAKKSAIGASPTASSAALLTFRQRAKNYGFKEGGPPPVMLSGAVRAARWFFQDRFVLIACGSEVLQYTYTLDSGPKDDVRRYQVSHRYKLVQAWNVSSEGAAVSIVAMNNLNNILSPIVLCSLSNRSIVAYDLEASKIAVTMEETHARPPHAIAVIEPSPYITHSTTAHDLFTTAACDGVVKLFDLRTAACERSFTGHANRVHSIGVAFSPCLRFLGCGSEDRAGYLYDLRTASLVGTMRPHTDVVSSVVFHPAHPQLVTACFDGHVRFWTDEANAL